jgi:hypothetical protein
MSNYETLIHVDQYNLVLNKYLEEHKKKMYWNLKSINNIQYCQVCNKIIFKYSYSLRRCNMVCCSIECVDNCTSEVW